MARYSTYCLWCSLWMIFTLSTCGCTTPEPHIDHPFRRQLLELSPIITFRDYQTGALNSGTGLPTRNVSVDVYKNDTVERHTVSFVMTAAHVVKNARIHPGELRVIKAYTLAEKTYYAESPAQLIAVSERLDLAVLAVETDNGPFFPLTAQFLTGEIGCNKTVYICNNQPGDNGRITSGRLIKRNAPFFLKDDNGVRLDISVPLVTSASSKKGSSGAGLLAATETGRLGAFGIVIGTRDQIWRRPDSLCYSVVEVASFVEEEGIPQCVEFIHEP